MVGWAGLLAESPAGGGGLAGSENRLDQGGKGNGIYFCRLGLPKTRNDVFFSGGFDFTDPSGKRWEEAGR